jgi:hypothetical protein
MKWTGDLCTDGSMATASGEHCPVFAVDMIRLVNIVMRGERMERRALSRQVRVCRQ